VNPIIYKPASDPATIAQGLREGWIVPAANRSEPTPRRTKPMQTEITKISLKKGTPTIKGNRYYPSGAVEEFTVAGSELAPELVAAMSQLLDTLCGFCCLGEQWDEGEITGATFKYTENGTGLVITGQLRVADDSSYVVVVNSPYIKPDMLGASEEMTVKAVLVAATDWMEALPQQLDLLKVAA
jgi:hypothetical protein